MTHPTRTRRSSSLQRLRWSGWTCAAMTGQRPLSARRRCSRAQANWVSAIKTISAVYFEGGDFVGTAATPPASCTATARRTCSSSRPRRPSTPSARPREEAMSYFVGARGDGERRVQGRGRRLRHQRRQGLVGRRLPQPPDRAHGRHRRRDGRLRVHVAADGSGTRCASSTPSATARTTTARCASSCTTRRCRTRVAPAGPKPITEEEVEIAQQLWADSIASISKVDRTPKPKPKPKPKFTLTLTLTRGRARALTLPLALTRCTSTAATTSRRPARRRASCTATATATCSSASPNPSPRPTRALTLTRTLA